MLHYSWESRWWEEALGKAPAGQSWPVGSPRYSRCLANMTGMKLCYIPSENLISWYKYDDLLIPIWFSTIIFTYASVVLDNCLLPCFWAATVSTLFQCNVSIIVKQWFILILRFVMQPLCDECLLRKRWYSTVWWAEEEARQLNTFILYMKSSQSMLFACCFPGKFSVWSRRGCPLNVYNAT